MSEGGAAKVKPVLPVVDAKLYPGPDFPTAYADGVLTANVGPGVLKLVFFRIDPSYDGIAPPNPMPNLQVVMPNIGFLGTVLYLEQILSQLIHSGAISQQQVDDMRSQLEKNVAAAQSQSGSPTTSS